MSKNVEKVAMLENKLDTDSACPQSHCVKI